MINLTKRLQISQIIPKAGKTAILGGWIYHRRDHGKISFLDLRDATGTIQLVITSSTKVSSKVKNWGLESVILAEGIIKKRPAKLVNKESETGHLEMEVKKLEVVSPTKEALPVDISKDIDKINLDTLLNYRALTLRNPKIQSIFKLSEKIEESYREFLRNEGFTEIHTPKIIPHATEGGANVFKVDYFNKEALQSRAKSGGY